VSSQIFSYALHPEAFNDIDEIRAYIAEDNPDAADRMVTEIFDSIRGLVSFPQQGYRRPNLTSLPLRFKLVRKICDRLRPRKKAVMGCGCFPRTANPPRDGSDLERPEVRPRRVSLQRAEWQR